MALWLRNGKLVGRPMNKAEIIDAVAKKIETQYNPQKIILFGSYAWGDPEEDSDLDLFVVKDTDDKPRKRALQVRRILDEENSLIGLDILVYTPEELSRRMSIGDTFLSRILSEGKILYEGKVLHEGSEVKD